MTEQTVVACIIEAYILIMGRQKWDSLTAQEQHDVIMMIVRDMLKT